MATLSNRSWIAFSLLLLGVALHRGLLFQGKEGLDSDHTSPTGYKYPALVSGSKSHTYDLLKRPNEPQNWTHVPYLIVTLISDMDHKRFKRFWFNGILWDCRAGESLG